MGQKLVSIKFNPGSSTVLWNPEYSPNFLIQSSNDGTTWEQITEYYPKITEPVTFPVDTQLVEQLTDSVIKKAIQQNQKIAFLVDDSSLLWRVQMRDNFLTGGEWERLQTGMWESGNYIPLEYIQSTGTQYINTGIYPNQDTSIEIKFLAESRTAGAFTLCGSFNGAWRPGFGLYGGNTSYQCNYVYSNVDSNTEPLYTFQANQMYTYALNKNVASLSINDVVISQKTTEEDVFELPTPIEIFRVSISTSPRYGKFNLYSFKVSSNNTLVQHLIPVKDLNDVACMYDKVSRQFFYNQGTGDFIAGPVIGN